MRRYLPTSMFCVLAALACVPASVLSQSLVAQPTAVVAESNQASLSACSWDHPHMLQGIISGNCTYPFALSIDDLRQNDGDSENIREELVPRIISLSKKRHYCYLPVNPTDNQRAKFSACEDRLPNCDRRERVISGEGGELLICTCRRFFSCCR